MSEAKALEWALTDPGRVVLIDDGHEMEVEAQIGGIDAEVLDHAAARLEATAREMRAKAASLRPPTPHEPLDGARCEHGMPVKHLCPQCYYAKTEESNGVR